MSGLPTQIPQQSVPLLQNNADDKPQFMDINWYLWAYSISKAVLGNGQGGGTTPISPYDVLDTANLFAQTADIPQAYHGLKNLAVLDMQNAAIWSADLQRVNRSVDNLRALVYSLSLQDPGHQAQPAQTVTVGASPFTYTALFDGTLSITAGAVSNVSIIRQGVTVATGIGSSSASAISSFTDEKGSGGQPGFVAGVDFTDGTSTSLTLSKSYGGASALWVAFDGAEQGPNTYTLSGTTLTFNAAIPIGTVNVFVKGATTSTISSSGGLVPLRRRDQVQITYTSAPTVVFLPA
jgi:hypothetical protein